MDALSVLLRLSEKHEPGPSPGFSREHAIMVFMTIGESGSISRQALARNSGLGEGSVRTVLKKFRQEGYVGADALGCHLTDSGKRAYRSITKVLTPLVPIEGSRLSVGSSQVAILVRSASESVTSGIEQRDSAIRVGAAGATTYIIRGRKFAIPGGSPDCERDFPSPTWTELRKELGPVDSDAVIICGAETEVKARLGALAAALTLV